MMIPMADVLAILTNPDLLTLIAYVFGAGIFGAFIIAGVIYICDCFDLMP